MKKLTYEQLLDRIHEENPDKIDAMFWLGYARALIDNRIITNETYWLFVQFIKTITGLKT